MISNYPRFVFLFCFTSFFLCSLQASAQTPWKFVSYETWSSRQIFPYQSPREKIVKIDKNFYKLKKSSTPQEIIALIGKPDTSEKIFDKKSGEFRGVVWDYYFMKLNRAGSNRALDVALHVGFNREGKVVKVDYTTACW